MTIYDHDNLRMQNPAIISYTCTGIASLSEKSHLQFDTQLHVHMGVCCTKVDVGPICIHATYNLIRASTSTLYNAVVL